MEEIVDALISNKAVLFAGAGLSAGLGAPTWSGLMDKMAADLGYDPAIFKSGGVSFWTLAEYYKLSTGKIGPLRSWMDRSWTVSEDELKKSYPHRIIGSLGFKAIYTTNYDYNIEKTLEINGVPYSKIANVKDIANAKEDRLHVVKLHGDFDDDSSIVLTETDYFRRMTFESPLDVRFRSDAVSNIVLFIGYSLTDINVRYLLFKLWETWESSGYQKERPKSYIFLTRPDPIQEAVLKNWNVEPLTVDDDDPGSALLTFLQDLEGKVGAKRRPLPGPRGRLSRASPSSCR